MGNTESSGGTAPAGRIRGSSRRGDDLQRKKQVRADGEAGAFSVLMQPNRAEGSSTDENNSTSASRIRRGHEGENTTSQRKDTPGSYAHDAQIPVPSDGTTEAGTGSAERARSLQLGSATAQDLQRTSFGSVDLQNRSADVQTLAQRTIQLMAEANQSGKTNASAATTGGMDQILVQPPLRNTAAIQQSNPAVSAKKSYTGNDSGTAGGRQSTSLAKQGSADQPKQGSGDRRSFLPSRITATGTSTQQAGPAPAGSAQQQASHPHQTLADLARAGGGSVPAQSQPMSLGPSQATGFGQTSQATGFGQSQPTGHGPSQPTGFGQSQPGAFGATIAPGQQSSAQSRTPSHLDQSRTVPFQAASARTDQPSEIVQTQGTADRSTRRVVRKTRVTTQGRSILTNQDFGEAQTTGVGHTYGSSPYGGGRPDEQPLLGQSFLPGQYQNVTAGGDGEAYSMAAGEDPNLCCTCGYLKCSRTMVIVTVVLGVLVLISAAVILAVCLRKKSTKVETSHYYNQYTIDNGQDAAAAAAAPAQSPQITISVLQPEVFPWEQTPVGSGELPRSGQAGASAAAGPPAAQLPAAAGSFLEHDDHSSISSEDALHVAHTAGKQVRNWSQSSMLNPNGEAGGKKPRRTKNLRGRS
ncbi:unnamed protein product [Amoebophrya sp. A120]|nr:unnamed protein product [Amoebophrya sp. A120]|eukprot:GSA120T00018597001.1